MAGCFHSCGLCCFINKRSWSKRTLVFSHHFMKFFFGICYDECKNLIFTYFRGMTQWWLSKLAKRMQVSFDIDFFKVYTLLCRIFSCNPWKKKSREFWQPWESIPRGVGKLALRKCFRLRTFNICNGNKLYNLYSFFEQT